MTDKKPAEKLADRNRTFFDFELPVSCFMLEEFRQKLRDAQNAGFEIEFPCDGGSMGTLRVSRDVAELLRKKGITGSVLLTGSLRGRNDPPCESWTFPVKECAIEVTLRIVEYRRYGPTGGYAIIKNPVKEAPDVPVLGRVAVLTAKVLDTIPA